MFVFLSCRTSTKPDIVSVQPVYEETHKNKKQGIIGASLSEPHTSESNGAIFIYIYIYIYIIYLSYVVP